MEICDHEVPGGRGREQLAEQLPLLLSVLKFFMAAIPSNPPRCFFVQMTNWKFRILKPLLKVKMTQLSPEDVEISWKNLGILKQEKQ